MVRSHSANIHHSPLPKITRKILNLRWEDGAAKKKAGQMVMLFVKILGERENTDTQYAMALAFGPFWGGGRAQGLPRSLPFGPSHGEQTCSFRRRQGLL